MGSGDTSFWENGFIGMPALEAFFVGNWSYPREFLSNSMKELFIIPAKKTVSDIVRCIDSQFRTTSEGGNGEEANSGQQAIEKKKCLGISQLQTQTSGVLGRSFSAGDGQGSPWAIQAVHIGSDEADSDDTNSEHTDVTELADQHVHLSSAAESEIVAVFKSVDNPLSSHVAEEETESVFTAVDNPMFDSSSVEGDSDCADRISNDDVKNYDVWENPEFLESISEVDRTLEEDQPPVTTLMTDNPLFQEGFPDKRATSLSNPLFENDSDADCDDTDCSTASYSDINTLCAETPVSGWKVGQVGLFDSASELLDALARVESAASTQHMGWHGYDVESEPPTPRLRSSSCDQGQISLAILVPREQESHVVSMDPGWISIGDVRRPSIDGIDSRPSKSVRRTCLGPLTRKNLAELSTKICCKVVWLIDCLLSMCQSCFPPVVGDYLPGSEYVMGL